MLSFGKFCLVIVGFHGLHTVQLDASSILHLAVTNFPPLLQTAAQFLPCIFGLEVCPLRIK